MSCFFNNEYLTATVISEYMKNRQNCSTLCPCLFYLINYSSNFVFTCMYADADGAVDAAAADADDALLKVIHSTSSTVSNLRQRKNKED